MSVVQLKERGNEWLAKGDNKRAVEMYSKALELEPSNVAVRSNRALAFLNLGDHAACIDDATIVLETAPANVKCLLRRSVALKSVGRLAAMFRCFCDFLFFVCILVSKRTLTQTRSSIGWSVARIF